MGTANMAHGPAMSRDEALQAIAVGIELVDEELAAGLDIDRHRRHGHRQHHGQLGRHRGAHRLAGRRRDRSRHRHHRRGAGRPRSPSSRRRWPSIEPDRDDPVDVLAKVGGLEIAALTGVVLGAAANRVPVVMDGFISSAAALAAVRLCHEAVDYILPSHVSIEMGHQAVLDELGLIPLFDLEMRLGEGTGAVLAMSIIEAAAKILDEMATFESAGIAGDPNDADADLRR